MGTLGCFNTTKEKMLLFRFIWTTIIDANIIHFLHKYKKVMYSDICIQDSNSEKCGKFCIAFIKYIQSRNSYNDFIAKFDFLKLYKNDEIVENIYL